MTTGEIPVLTFAQVAVASARERQARKSRRQPASSIGRRNRARSLRQDPCAPRLNRRGPWACRYRPSRRSRGRASASRRHSADLRMPCFPTRGMDPLRLTFGSVVVPPRTLRHSFTGCVQKVPKKYPRNWKSEMLYAASRALQTADGLSSKFRPPNSDLVSDLG